MSLGCSLARDVVIACLAACLAYVASGCGGDAAGPDAAPVRQLTLNATVTADGRSAPLEFAVPDGTRSVAIVVEGDPAALYGLAALTFSDGVDRVQLPAGAPGPAMHASYRDEQIGQMPGMLYQSIRLGTFTQVYPYRPDQDVITGAASLEIASDTPGPVTVTIVMAPDDGARTLHLNVVVVSDAITVTEPPAFEPELARILAQADITVVIDQVLKLTGTELENITDFSEPQEAPTSQTASLSGLLATPSVGALDVFIVESLPAGVRGLSLGTPGPPLPGSYYYGVVVRPGSNDVDTGRVLAHEACHFLALQHVQNVGISGALYPDPLDDTSPGNANLMAGSGTSLTPGQIFALGRSALLTD